MMDIKKRIANCIITMSLLLSLIGGCLSGCGVVEAAVKGDEAKNASEAAEEKDSQASSKSTASKTYSDDKPDDEEIELIEPVGVATNSDVAAIRDIVDAEVYSCVCCPGVTEFEYTSDTPFGRFGKLPGEEVKTGDVLIYGSLDDIDEQIKDLEEEMGDKARDFAYEMSNLSEDIYDLQKDQFPLAETMMSMINNEPSDDSPWYNMWARGYMPVDESYKNLVRSIAKLEEQAKEKEELFVLEIDYDQGRIERMKNRQTNSNITTNRDGVVVATNFYQSGDNVNKNSKAMAVGDVSQKIFHTEFINKTTLAKAEDIYALIDGKRYEVTYDVIEKDEYTRLLKQNDVVYSNFYIDDPNNEISQGQFGDIVLINKIVKNVLTIPNDAISRDGSEFYVYTYQNDTPVRTTIEVGARDGMYAEVVSGLMEGDKVMTTKAVASSKKTKILEKGSLSSEFSEAGYLFYPSSEWIVNPAKTGTSYIKEVLVEQYQKVEKGQELAKIEVVSDNIEIQRIERQISRQQERLVKLLQDKEENNRKSLDIIDRALDRAIVQKQRAIEDLTEKYNELKEYTGIITLTAPYNGIITEKPKLEPGDLISYKQNILQISDETQSFIFVEDTEGRLTYGNEATISYKGEGGVKKEVTGTVVSVSCVALSKELNTGYAIISLPKEEIEEMAVVGSMQSMNGYWNRSMFDVSARIRSVDDVVIVPKSMVTELGGDTYVKVNTEDGRGSYVSFIAGGADMTNYWVVSGLEEGMEICSE